MIDNPHTDLPRFFWHVLATSRWVKPSGHTERCVDFVSGIILRNLLTVGRAESGGLPT